MDHTGCSQRSDAEVARIAAHAAFPAATVKAALDLDESKALPERPLVWASSFLDQRKAPLKFTVDTAMLTTGLAGLSGNAAAKAWLDAANARVVADETVDGLRQHVKTLLAHQD